MDTTKTLDNGDVLAIGSIPFSISNKFRRTVASELMRVKLPEIKGIPLNKEGNPDIGSADISDFKDLFLVLFASESIEREINSMLARCTYNDIKITPEFWDENEEAQENYVPCALEVAQVALRPTLKGLGSLFVKNSKTPAENQPSKTN